MKRLTIIFYQSAFVIAALLTAHIIDKTADLTAEKAYLKREKERFLSEITDLLNEQQLFKPYLEWDYYSYNYVMKMQDDSTYSVYRDLHRYRRNISRLLSELADFHNNHIRLWYHRQAVLPRTILQQKRGPLPKNIAIYMTSVQHKLLKAKHYFNQLP